MKNEMYYKIEKDISDGVFSVTYHAPCNLWGSVPKWIEATSSRVKEWKTEKGARTWVAKNHPDWILVKSWEEARVMDNAYV